MGGAKEHAGRCWPLVMKLNAKELFDGTKSLEAPFLLGNCGRLPRHSDFADETDCTAGLKVSACLGLDRGPRRPLALCMERRFLGISGDAGLC